MKRRRGNKVKVRRAERRVDGERIDGGEQGAGMGRGADDGEKESKMR